MAQHRKWQITAITKTGNEICISDNWVNDYAFRYDNGSIGYNHPDSLPKYIKDAVKKQFDKMFSTKLLCPHFNCQYNKKYIDGNGYCRHHMGTIHNIRTGAIKASGNITIGCTLHRLYDGKNMHDFPYIPG